MAIRRALAHSLLYHIGLFLLVIRRKCQSVCVVNTNLYFMFFIRCVILALVRALFVHCSTPQNYPIVSNMINLLIHNTLHSSRPICVSKYFVCHFSVETQEFYGMASKTPFLLASQLTIHVIMTRLSLTQKHHYPMVTL